MHVNAAIQVPIGAIQAILEVQRLDNITPFKQLVQISFTRSLIESVLPGALSRLLTFHASVHANSNWAAFTRDCCMVELILEPFGNHRLCSSWERALSPFASHSWIMSGLIKS